jgi:hypothetical protein
MNIKETDVMTVRLAHFVPLGEGETDLSEVTKMEMVLNGLYFSIKILSLTELKMSIQTSLGCDIHISELSELIEKAVNVHYVNKLKVNTITKYNLTEEIRTKLDLQFKIQQDIQERVIYKWAQQEIISFYPELSEDIILEIQIKLVEFLTKLFLSHGVMSLNLMNGESREDITMNLSEIIEGMSFTVQQAKDIALETYPSFLSIQDFETINYLTSIIEKAFKYLATICDPQILNNLKTTIEGKVVLLDSSIVYRLLQLQGLHRYRVIREVVDLCQEFGLNLKVTGTTLKELERRIGFDSRVLREYPTPINLSAVGYNYITEENFISSYWEQSKVTGISINDFIAIYIHIDKLLINEGIKVETEINIDDKLEQRIKEIISKISMRTDQEKSYNATDHDAYMIATVEKSRKDMVLKNFIESPCWLLTSDQFLMRFQRTDHDFKEKLPFAVLPTQLINILRFIKPMHERFNEVFLEVFSKSFMSSNVRRLNNTSIQQVLARVATYKGYTPGLAHAILSDQLFTTRYIQKQTQGEQEELIHEYLVEKAEELEILNDQNKQVINQLEGKLVELEDKVKAKEEIAIGIFARVDTLKEQAIAAEEAHLMLREQATSAAEESEIWKENVLVAKEELEVWKNKVNIATEALESEIKEKNIIKDTGVKRIEKLQNDNKKLIRLLSIIIYLVVIAVLMYVVFKIPKTYKLIRAIIFSCVALGIIPVIRVVFDNDKAKLVATIVGLIATLAAFFYGIL